ncbi:MAG: LysR substrate-binding domain-containing protein [Leisingera sp.]
MLNFTLRQLEHLEASARTGSIAAAARELSVTAAAVAASLGKLEEVSGLVLFDRFPAQGVRLTAAGREVLERAEVLLAQGQALQLQMRGLEDTSSGHLRFGCYHALGYVFAPEILMRHRQRWPKVTLEVFEGSFAELNRQLETGGTDLALAYDQGFDQNRLEVELLMRVRPKVLLAAAHPLASRKALELGDLQDLPYILVKEAGPGPSYFDMLKTAGLEPEIALTTRSYEMARSCVGKGAGYTLMAFQPPNPRTYHNDRVVSVPLAEPLGEVAMVLAARPGVMQMPFARAFADTCREAVLTNGPA